MAWPDRRQDALHRTGKSLGERLLREPELKAQRRAAKRRDLHDDAGGASADRELETPLQCHPPALVARLSAAGPRGDLAASVRSALRSASASPDAGRRRPGSNLVPGIVPRGRPKVRLIFRRYLELGSVHALAEELNKKKILSHRRVTQEGRTIGGRPITRGNLYLILQ